MKILKERIFWGRLQFKRFAKQVFRFSLRPGGWKLVGQSASQLLNRMGFMKYTIFKDTNVATVVVADAVTLQDCIRSVDGFLAGASLEAGMQLLIDLTSVKPELSFGELRELVWHVKKLIQSGVSDIAITAAGDFVYGLARVFSAYADIDGFNVSVFRTQEKARTWLEGCRPATYPSIQNNTTVIGEIR
ncbi:MAG TPA: hypothetical protein VK699_17480 [Terriglobales bacterium]|nr:hypothetical protein [Terriglobales bacterium]